MPYWCKNCDERFEEPVKLLLSFRCPQCGSQIYTSISQEEYRVWLEEREEDEIDDDDREE